MAYHPSDRVPIQRSVTWMFLPGPGFSPGTRSLRSEEYAKYRPSPLIAA
ncbi:hypothetical protein [Streptomyces syringium]